MYIIEKKIFGYKLTFEGFMLAEEMRAWVEESREVLKTAPASFGVFVDMRSLKPLPADAQAYMQEGQKLYRARGMARSVVIVDNAVTKIQFKRIARETGIYEWERYIDASDTPGWEQAGIDWVQDGKDTET